MKKATVILISSFFVIVFITMSFSAEKTLRRQVTGTVTAVNEEENTITVEGRKSDVTVYANEKTRILEEETKSFSDIKIGDKVTVKYKVADDERNTAKRITIRVTPVKSSSGN